MWLKGNLGKNNQRSALGDISSQTINIQAREQEFDNIQPPRPREKEKLPPLPTYLKRKVNFYDENGYDGADGAEKSNRYNYRNITNKEVSFP